MKSQWRANVIGLIAIFVVCLAALKGRTWLSEYAQYDMAAGMYFLLVWPVVAIVSALVLSKIYRRPKVSISVREHGRNSAKVENIFRYPRSYGFVAIGAAAVFIVAAWSPEREMGAPVYFIIAAVVFSAMLLALYVFIFRITLDSEELIVRGFRQRHYKLSDIVSFDLKMDRGGKYGILTLSDNLSVSFWGILKNFDDLAGILSYAAKNAKK